MLFKNSFSPFSFKYWFFTSKREKIWLKHGCHTQSIPLRRWIPIYGPRGKVLWIYSSTSLLILSDHFRKACGWRFCSSTGKLAGAPLKARTGCFEGGNLTQKRRWTFQHHSFKIQMPYGLRVRSSGRQEVGYRPGIFHSVLMDQDWKMEITAM